MVIKGGAGSDTSSAFCLADTCSGSGEDSVSPGIIIMSFFNNSRRKGNGNGKVNDDIDIKGKVIVRDQGALVI